MKLAHNPFASLNNSGVTCGFSSRDCGNMSLFYGDTKGALENRRDFFNTLNMDYRGLVCAKQVHGNNVKCVSENEKGMGSLDYESSIPDTDALITDIKNIPLAIFTADCLSIFLYDPRTPAIGMVHAGWRSSKENIVSCAIDLMRSRFNTNPTELFASFGPSIRNCCCEMGAEFEDCFPSGTVKRSGRIFLDLLLVNRKQLTGSGLKEENIFDAGACTYCNPQDFFSFRREGKASGRMISVIMLR